MKKFFCCFLAIALIFSTNVIVFGKADRACQAESLDERYAASNIGIQPLGGISIGSQTRTRSYTYRTEEDYFNPKAFPTYLSDFTGACAINSGGAIIAHYDIQYDELIPNHSATYKWGIYMYPAQSSAITAMFNNIYNLMGTNSSGTTVEGYKAGLASYVNGKGRNVAINSVFSNNQLNYSQYKSAIDSGKLLTVFVQNFTLTETDKIKQDAGYDSILMESYAGRHTFAVYGYKTVRYYNANWNLINEDFYLYVKTGLEKPNLGLFLLNEGCIIEDGYIINIY